MPRAKRDPYTRTAVVMTPIRLRRLIRSMKVDPRVTARDVAVRLVYAGWRSIAPLDPRNDLRIYKEFSKRSSALEEARHYIKVVHDQHVEQGYTAEMMQTAWHHCHRNLDHDLIYWRRL